MAKGAVCKAGQERAAVHSSRHRGTPAALPPSAEPEAAAPADPAAAPSSEQQQQQQPPQEGGLAGLGKAILENRRVIAVAVAVADVAFLWVAIKLGKSWWTANH